MDPKLVEYLIWFKENEKGMKPGNDLASSALHTSENAIVSLLVSQQLVDRLLHDPWWHPALLKHIKQQYNLSEGKELIITNGASGAIWLVFQALVSPSDHVIIESPVYQPLLSVPRFLKADISLLERRPEENFEINKARLESLLRPNTKLIVLTNLHNPSGHPLGDGVLDWLKGIVKQHGGNIKVMIDETFRDLIPTERVAAANLDESFISINTLSKAYGLATLRCGWIVSSGEIYPRIRDTYVLVENAGSPLTESIASLVIEHLDSHQKRALKTCAKNQRIIREFMKPLLAEKRILGRIPTYGCLYFPRIANMGDTEEFTRELRDSWDVYVAPGRFFGAPEHIRIGFGGDAEHLPGKLERLAGAIRAVTTPMSGPRE
ncbi:MAG TPA: aminotransferase class I/II-fold pyridoxal phosphate-dependent enzyme [Chloroflexia bacterium]